ncbi:MAG: hypothetical protein Hals2KO_00420 [Halioglobus sp.]
MNKLLTGWFVVSVLLCAAPKAAADSAQLRQQLAALDESLHTVRVEYAVNTVTDHKVALGAIRKLHGEWILEDSERLSGELSSFTWQIVDGFTSKEVMEELLETVSNMAGAQQLFACDGRACGHSSQWANRVFGQRVLYGRQDLQRYRVYSLPEGAGYRLVVYASARSTDRQYLRVDLIAVQPSAQGTLDLTLHLQ